MVNHCDYVRPIVCGMRGTRKSSLALRKGFHIQDDADMHRAMKHYG